MTGKTVEVPSRRYGRYLVRSRLGAGGMAEVFLAEAIDEHGEQLNVALKLMRKDVPEDVFNDEADLMGLLSHGNLVQRLEIGHAFGRPFIAMEFLIGGDLRGVMEVHRKEARAFPLEMAIHVILEVLRALAYFHLATTRTGTPLNLVHGDVNPTNVFFSAEGEVKLGDFGVAKGGHGIGPAEGVAAGKLHYLSPEQTRGEPLSGASDLFAVGLMMHELVVGRHPLDLTHRDPRSVMAALRGLKLALPEGLDRRLAGILQRACAVDLRHRYRTAGEFAGDLLHYALDNNRAPGRREVRAWFEGAMGLLL